MSQVIPTYSRVFFIFMVFAGFLSVSCKTPRTAVYFNNIKDTTFRNIKEDIKTVIRPNDLLSISVSSLNPEASIIFNAPNVATVSVAGAASQTGGSSQSSGYLVDPDGSIQFPILGTVKAAGLTKQELKDQLTKSLLDRKLLVDPIVSIRFLNFRVTVLGEVLHPTVVTVPNEKISILEAIGLAGDLTIYARRDNILLIREENGQKVVRRLNLNSSEIFTSPYYYLKTNDIVYAEPNKARLETISTGSNVRLYLPSIISGLSLIAVILTRVL